MAIDVFAADDKTQQNLLYQIDSVLLNAIAPALAQLKSRTGVVIDPYATGRLYRDHYLLLAQLLLRGKNLERHVAQFAAFLTTCKHEILTLVGD
jgi:hypothetical protein